MAAFDRSHKDLSPDQFRAIAALVSTGSFTKAAVSVGVSERTLRRWMEQATFKERLILSENELISSSVRRLGALVEQALDVLENVMADVDTSSIHKTRAAALVLDSALRWRNQLTIEDRVTSLERKMGITP